MAGVLTPYDTACRSVAEALADAKTLGEVMGARGRAEALRVFARMAGNREMEIDAAEIRILAERRLGQELLKGKAKGEFGVGRKPENSPDQEPFEEIQNITLAEIGVDKKLSAYTQKLGALDDDAFAQVRSDWRERVVREGERVTVSLLKEKLREGERQARAERTADGCTVADLNGLIAQGSRFGVILVDPPSEFKTRSKLGEDRAAANHYRVSSPGEIAGLPVTALAARDCLLAIWTSGPHLLQALGYIDHWGFAYKTIGFDWMKLNPDGDGLFMGAGYWTRANAEIVLFATRGHPSRLDAGVRSAVLAPVSEHSAKPAAIHEGLERLVGGPYLELFARAPRAGWTVWGDEIGRDALVAPDPADAPARDAKGHLLPPAWLDEGRRMRRDGARYIDIAVHFQRSPATICEVLNRYGLGP